MSASKPAEKAIKPLLAAVLAVFGAAFRAMFSKRLRGRLCLMAR